MGWQKHPRVQRFGGIPEIEALERRSVKVGELDREYLLAIPEGAATAGSLPVVLGFHGGGGNPMQFAAQSQLHTRATDRGFVVAYPAGYGTVGELGLVANWNSSDHCCGPAFELQVDDTAFVRAVLADIGSLIQVDANRVFAVGQSNGGMLSYRLACELSEQISAIAVSAGSMNLEGCRPERPVSVLVFHGTEDPIHPYAGGTGVLPRFQMSFDGALRTVARWVSFNECGPIPDTRREGSVVITAYQGGREGSEVVLHSVIGMGHQWPGRTVEFSADEIEQYDLRTDALRGPGDESVDATGIVLDFFQTHGRLEVGKS